MKKPILTSIAITFLIIMLPYGSITAPHENTMAYEKRSNDIIVPSIFHVTHGPIAIFSDMDFVNQDWPGNGTSANPYLIQGLSISEDGICISVVNTTSYFEVRDCIITSSVTSQHIGVRFVNVTHGAITSCVMDSHSAGIRLVDSFLCNATFNVLHGNSDYGILLDNSDFCLLANNVAMENENGIYLFCSDNCTVTNNYTNSNKIGFITEFSSNCAFLNNTGTNNSYYGFNLRFIKTCSLMSNTAYNNTRNGFYLENMNSCFLVNNTAMSNYNGFFVYYSDRCIFVNNTAVNNRDRGIFISSGCENNTLYLNRMGNNSLSNARDEGELNQWDDNVSTGNYWDDYNGTGIYVILGSAESVDNYPFVWGTVASDDSANTTLIMVFSGIAIVIIALTGLAFRRWKSSHK